MNFTIERSTLLTALNHISGIVARREIIPILSHVLLEASGPTLTIRATNGDMEATVTVDANIRDSGKACVSADKLTAIVKNSADGDEISFDLKDRLNIKSGRSSFKLATLPVEDFPTFADFDVTSEFVMSSGDMAAIVGRVAFAQCDDNTRYIMCGVHLFSDGTMGGAAATNGQRMALSERAVDWAPFSVTIPTPMVGEMTKLEGELTVRIGSKIQVATADTVITSKLLSGEYVAFRRFIPTALDWITKADCEGLVWAIRRAALASDDKSRAVRLELEGISLSASARGMDADAKDEIECEFNGDAYAFSVNSAFMLDALGSIQTETVELAFPLPTDRVPKPPFIVRSSADDGFLNMVAPLGLG